MFDFFIAILPMLLILSVYLVAALAVVSVVRSDQEDLWKIVWVIGILFAPIIGVPAWWIFALTRKK